MIRALRISTHRRCTVFSRHSVPSTAQLAGRGPQTEMVPRRSLVFFFHDMKLYHNSRVVVLHVGVPGWEAGNSLVHRCGNPGESIQHNVSSYQWPPCVHRAGKAGRYRPVFISTGDRFWIGGSSGCYITVVYLHGLRAYRQGAPEFRLMANAV